ncbi:MAG: DUF1761 domain-containing protein [Bacteroidales bacterium]
MENLSTPGVCPMSSISYLWYSVAVITVFAFGALWYSWLFAKAWKNAILREEGEPTGCPFLPLFFQFIATALIGLMYFLLTQQSLAFSITVLVAISAWQKANLKFQISSWKRFITLSAIDVGYFAIASIVFILFASI